MNEIEKLKNILVKEGVSITKPRLAVFKTLQKSDEPLRTAEIARRTPSIDRASVYRTLELFSRLGITVTVVRGWTPHTELAEPFKDHHHHIVCSQCNQSKNIESDTLEDVLSLIASRNGFTLDQHTVELSGLCRDCQQKITN
ncbi:transcriptional repressor [Candidatus Saccharibacteria bacterium]|nr:transcriptional repressor [Candidatus Saccharibacteria bacterium]